MTMQNTVLDENIVGHSLCLPLMSAKKADALENYIYALISVLIQVVAIAVKQFALLGCM